MPILYHNNKVPFLFFILGMRFFFKIEQTLLEKRREINST